MTDVLVLVNLYVFEGEGEVLQDVVAVCDQVTKMVNVLSLKAFRVFKGTSHHCGRYYSACQG